jgi:hypothetical protein
MKNFLSLIVTGALILITSAMAFGGPRDKENSAGHATTSHHSHSATHHHSTGSRHSTNSGSKTHSNIPSK